MMYPFSDDTLFRGNNRTLECLKLTLDPITIDMLQTSNTFAPGQYTKLHNVSVYNIDRFSEVQTITDYAYTSFVLKMSPALQIFTDKSVLMSDRQLRFFHNSSSLAGLRILCLPDLTVYMSNLVPLLKALRQLESIECRLILDDLGMSAECMRPTYNPLSARLKHVELTSYEEVYDSVFQSIVLLAMVCPALMRCYIVHESREKLNAFVDSAVEAMPPSACRDRLLAIKYIEY
ncbi:hypothetical protein GGI21_004157 [Coemansia aciculifera]|nr:hypothetical protein GGI21_004157 [Coemansia aciculifera]